MKIAWPKSTASKLGFLLKFDSLFIMEFFALIFIFLHIALMPGAGGREEGRVMPAGIGFLSGVMKLFWSRQG